MEPTDTPIPTSTPTATPTATTRVITGMIDDFADCEGSNVYGGPWFIYGAGVNTFTNPPPIVTPGYKGNSDCAIKFEGSAAISCDYGVWMVNAILSGAPADLSGNTAISFYSKGSGTYRIVLMSNATTNNDYQWTFDAATDWTRIEIPFSSFTQPQTWGAVELSKALSEAVRIGWANGQCNMTIDLLVDEIKVY